MGGIWLFGVFWSFCGKLGGNPNPEFPKKSLNFFVATYVLSHKTFDFVLKIIVSSLHIIQRNFKVTPWRIYFLLPLYSLVLCKKSHISTPKWWFYPLVESFFWCNKGIFFASSIYLFKSHFWICSYQPLYHSLVFR